MNFKYKKIKLLLEEISDLEKASNPETNPEELEEIYHAGDPSIKSTVIKNPNIAKEFFIKNSEHHPSEAIDNPSFNLWGLEDTNFLHSLPHRPLISLLRKSGVSPDILHILHSHPHKSVRINVASHNNTQPETLESLVNEADPSIRHHISLNNNTHANTLKKLLNMHSNSNSIKGNIAIHPNADLQTLHLLAKDEEPRVRVNLLDRDYPNKEILKILAKDEHRKIRDAAADQLEAYFNE